MTENSIITEVRKAREAHAAKFNYDSDLIVADIKRNEMKLRRAGWKFAAPARPQPKAAKV